MHRFLASATLVLILGVAATPAQSAPVDFSNRALWMAATTGVTTDDFSQFGGGSNSLGNSYSYNGVTYTGASQVNLYGVGSLGFDAAYLTDSYFEWQSPVPFSNIPSVVTLTFASAITAVGFDFGTLFGLSEAMSVSIGGGPTYDITPATNAFAFFGIVTDVAFNSITITNANPHGEPGNRGFPTLDNLLRGFNAAEVEAAPVPEPATLLLLATGLGALTLRRHRNS